MASDTIPREHALQGKYVGINGSDGNGDPYKLYVLDGTVYSVGTVGDALCVGDWFEYCAAYRKNKAKGTLPASCVLVHIP